MTEDEIMPLAVDCLDNQVWPEDIQEVFIGDCISAGKEGLGEEKAVNYCNCMAQELARMFPDVDDYDLSEEELSELAEKCLFAD